MNIQQLEYFLYVKDTGSLNAAAQHFFITRQAINSSLKKLEMEIGAPLFQYNHKGVTITPQGLIFVPYAERILDNHTNALKEITLYQEQELNLQGTLTIYAASIFTELFLPPVIREFQVYHPQIDIQIIEIDNARLLGHLLRDDLNIGLFSYTKNSIEELLCEGDSPDLSCIHLMDDTLVLCGRADNPLMRNRMLSIRDCGQCLLKYNQSFSLYQVNPTCEIDGLANKVIARSSNAALHRKLMQEDIALTFMPKLAYRAQFEQEGIRAVDITDGQKIMHGILYKKDADSALQQVFLHYLERELCSILMQADLLQ